MKENSPIMELNPATTAFIAMHFENDIVGADGPFAGFFRAEIEKHNVIATASRLLSGARKAGATVVYARVAYSEGHANLVTNIPLAGAVAEMQCLLEGTAGTEITSELTPEASDWISTNAKVSAFAGCDLDDRLRAAGIDTVVLFGVATNISVESSGRSAGDLGYRVVIVSDACSAAAQEAHDATLASFGLLGEVASSADILAAL
jgi:biuret amidohydrolase